MTEAPYLGVALAEGLPERQMAVYGGLHLVDGSGHLLVLAALQPTRHLLRVLAGRNSGDTSVTSVARQSHQSQSHQAHLRYTSVTCQSHVRHAGRQSQIRHRHTSDIYTSDTRQSNIKHP